jgi:hypothetical protein
MYTSFYLHDETLKIKYILPYILILTSPLSKCYQLTVQFHLFDCEHIAMFGSSLPSVVCGRAHILFVGGLISCLWEGLISCLWEGSYLVCRLVGGAHILFVGGLISCLCLCLFVHSGVQHILCYVFALFVFFLCALYCQFLWIVHFDCPATFSIL